MTMDAIPSTQSSTKNLKRLSIAVVLAVMVALALWWVGASEFVAHDACLDSGGRWEDGGSCQFEQPQG